MLVSVIIPVYNTEKYIKRCIESVISQTYKNWELILVDDGSTDSSGQICDYFSALDGRINVIHKVNAGVAEARIDGFKYSRGDFVAFIDSDDYVSPHYLDKMISAQKEYNVPLVCTQYFEVDKGIEKLAPIRNECGYYDKNRITELLKNNFLFDICTRVSGMVLFLHTKLIRKDFVENILSIGKGLVFGEDQVGIFLLLCCIPDMYVLSDGLYYYVKHDGQVTRKYDVNLWSNFERYYTVFNVIDKNNYLCNQINRRMLFYLFMLINMEAKNSKSLICFSNRMKIIHQYTFVEAALKSDNSGLNLKEVIKYNLIKSDYCCIFYMLHKIKRLLVR